MRCLVAGAGGFIGGHLVSRLLADGHHVTAVDIKHGGDWWQVFTSDRLDRTFMEDLRHPDACRELMGSYPDVIYNLAADMGGIGFIETNKAACMVSVLINTNLLRAAVEHNARSAMHGTGTISRYFYSSSACVYHALRQEPLIPGEPKPIGLAKGWYSLSEEDAYFNGGAMPEDGYGWEKLFSERMCRHFREDYGLETRVARLHNVYGPQGSWRDGREKAPAAICRKVAEAKLAGHLGIDVWGDGTQQRSFCWIDDCIDGILKITESDYPEPLNLGSSEMVTVDRLISLVEDVAGYKVERRYDTTKPLGVAGRNSNNQRIKGMLGWEPSTPLRDGLRQTYQWIEKQVGELGR